MAGKERSGRLAVSTGAGCREDLPQHLLKIGLDHIKLAAHTGTWRPKSSQTMGLAGRGGPTTGTLDESLANRSTVTVSVGGVRCPSACASAPVTDPATPRAAPPLPSRSTTPRLA